jgi:hypothetical protein
MIGEISGFVLIVVLIPLLVNEAGDLAPSVAKRLLRWGARRVGPADKAERYEEELSADLERVPGKVTKLVYVSYVLAWTVPRLRGQFRQRPRRAWLSGIMPDRTRTTYRLHVDTEICDLKNRLLGPRLMKSGCLIPDASLAVMQVHNSGRRIEADHPMHPLSFTFEGRDIIEVEVITEAYSAIASRLAGAADIKIAGSTVVLPTIPMLPWNSFRVLVLLSGTGEGVTGAGFAKNGRFMRGPGRGAQGTHRA